MEQAIQKVWCDDDKHRRYENFIDFNLWLDSDDGEKVRQQTGVLNLTQPSKALFAGDRQAYDQAFREYRIEQRHNQLNKTYIEDISSGDHWPKRNFSRFDQLVECIQKGSVVPFVGAGLSQPGGFPTWKEHLQQQGRTAGIDATEIEEQLDQGAFEQIIEQIEDQCGKDVFVQEIRDAFSGTGTITEAIYLLAEMFSDTIITTNYDHLIEQAFETGVDVQKQIVTPANITTPPDTNKTTIIKLHGDISTPAGCILSKEQYDEYYGAEEVGISLDIPQALKYYFLNSSLLFLGCSLNQDRTIRIFEKIKKTASAEIIPQHFVIEQCPLDEQKMVDRNSYLLGLGITPIWFEPGQFEFVEGILRLARNELRYQRA